MKLKKQSQNKQTKNQQKNKTKLLMDLWVAKPLHLLGNSNHTAKINLLNYAKN